jgi:excinuclease ABC subunit C
MDANDLQRLAPPDSPGVYLMKDAHGKIIYVGKAVSLKKRLTSYFRPADQLDAKTQALVTRLHDLELMLTDSEVEALILECTLIKKHRPRYNILMRDDKSFPYLKLTVSEPFPRLLQTRKPFVDESRYFGPFLIGGLKELAKALSLHFGLRICKLDLKPGVPLKRPCLYAQMGQCDAVCQGREGTEAYGRRVAALLDFLEGGDDTFSPRLEQEMRQAAEMNQFELAAELRDRLQAVAELRQKPLLASTGREDRDVLGLARSGAAATVEILTIRAGNLEGRRHYYLQHVGADTPAELLSQVLTQYYTQPVLVPGEILLPEAPSDGEVIARWLGERVGRAVSLSVPTDPQGQRLLKMAEANAWLFLKHSADTAAGDLSDADRQVLADLARQLGLAGPPLRIEGYDISNLSGSDPVGSQVVLVNGHPERSQYRRYRIKAVPGPNDLAMLQEMLYRRFRHLQEEGGIAPDLVVVDGGAGQVSAALAVLRDLNLGHLPLAGLAKQEEEIYRPEQPVPLRLPKDSRALHVLMRLRDEAHRFAVAYHRKLRGRRMSVSALDRVPGVGQARRRTLLRAFGSVEAILQVPEAELAAVPGIGPELAQRIRRRLAGAGPVGRPFHDAEDPEGKA